MRRAAAPSAGRRLRYSAVPPHASSAPLRFELTSAVRHRCSLRACAARLRVRCAFPAPVRQTPLLIRARAARSRVSIGRRPCGINDWPVATCQISPPPTLKVSPLLRTDVREVATRSPGARLKKEGGREKVVTRPRGTPVTPPPVPAVQSGPIYKSAHSGGVKKGKPCSHTPSGALAVSPS